ncbi:MAG: tetratricopeptide repeat protein, partial [Chitinophagaceae bacterium]|nr:tetratricopeptide repeat protein [Chitinophagaceae bacterium]
MKIIIIIALFLLTFDCYAQRNIDSLKLELEKEKVDSNRLKILHRISGLYRWSFPDSAIKYAEQGTRLAEQLNERETEIEILHILGEALAGRGNFYNALQTQLKSLNLSEKLHDERLITWSLCNIGIVHYYAKEYDKALQYFLAAKANETMYKKYVKTIATFIGEAYFQLNRLDSALFYIESAYRLDMQDKSHWSVPYYMMAYISEKKGELERSLNYFREGISIAIPTLDSINGFIGMGRIYKKLGKMDSATLFVRKALALGERASLAYTIVEATSLLADIFKSQHRIDSAFKYQEILLAAKDSLFNQQREKEMQNLSFNERLRQQELKAANIKQKNWMRLYTLLAILATVLTIGAFLWRSNINKQKAYALLAQQKQEIEKQHAAIQVEAALARVRASAMAMRDSRDVSNAVSKLFGELNMLGTEILRCGIAIVEESQTTVELWTAILTTEGRIGQIRGKVDVAIHPLVQGIFDAWKKGEHFFTYELKGKELVTFYNALSTGYTIPIQYTEADRQIVSAFYFTEGCLFIYTPKPLSEEIKRVLEKFAGVFALTYRRYLDLKQAEEQARKAVIQA